MHDFQFIVINFDGLGQVKILAHYISLFQTDKQAKVFADLKGKVHQMLYIFLSVCGDCNINSKYHIMYVGLTIFHFGSEVDVIEGFFI